MKSHQLVSDTTGNTLANCFYLLAIHPSTCTVLQKYLGEIFLGGDKKAAICLCCKVFFGIQICIILLRAGTVKIRD